MRFETQTVETIGMPDWLASDILTLEQEAFLQIYKTCPGDKQRFMQKYAKRHLIVTAVLENARVAGARIYARLDESTMESLAMMVAAERQRLGFGSLLCSISSAYLRWKSYRHITSFTHVDNQAASLMHTFAPIISTHAALTTQENNLLRLIEQAHSLPFGKLGTKRRVANYYPMRDGSSGDANFWVHEL